MTDKPDTSPEAVEANCQELLDTCKGQPATIPWPHRPQHNAVRLVRALAAERDAAVARAEAAEKKLAGLEKWQIAAFMVHSNLDLDIEANPEALATLEGQDD